MKLNNFPKVLWINLDKSKDRCEYMEYLLKVYKLNHQRIEGIDGTRSCHQDLENICQPNVKLTPAENACTCSHLKAMKYFLEETDEDQVVIFEDDVSFDFLQYIPYDWSDLMNQLPECYGVIHLAITSETNQNITRELVKTTSSTKYYCSTAYMIKRDAAEKIINEYYSKEENRFILKNKTNATADAIITNTNSTYSIPIFTYQIGNSLIHPHHWYIHYNSKMKQLAMWKNTN